jgi:hypothetical protein
MHPGVLPGLSISLMFLQAIERLGGPFTRP